MTRDSYREALPDQDLLDDFMARQGTGCYFRTRSQQCMTALGQIGF